MANEPRQHSRDGAGACNLVGDLVTSHADVLRHLPPRSRCPSSTVVPSGSSGRDVLGHNNCLGRYRTEKNSAIRYTECDCLRYG